jgi:hypothetical protein
MGDRLVAQSQSVDCEFLGAKAPFPTGTMRLAHAVRAPVVLFFGLYCGANRYHVHLELLSERIELSPDRSMSSGTAVAKLMLQTGDGVPTEPRRDVVRWSSLCVYSVMLLWSLSQALAGSVWTVEALMGELKAQREVSLPFEETTYSKLLTEPVKARGVLKFVPPETLEKLITSPSHERYVVEGDRVTFESQRKGVKRTISLEEHPALRSFVEAFRSSLNGDVARLRQVYEVALDGSRANWTLLLRPRESSGKAVLDYILLTGSEGRVRTIALRSPDGDRSVMTLLQGPAR